MAADFNKPVTTDNYAELLDFLRENQEVLARMFASGTIVSNIPVGAVRFDSGKFQSWSGSAWTDTPISIDGGGTGTQSAADARASLGTSDAANVTTGTFSSERIPGLDASKIISGILTVDTSGNASTATNADTANSAPWSGITGKPAVIGAGSTAIDARQAIGATGNEKVEVFNGEANSIDMDSLVGGNPGSGLYLISYLPPDGISAYSLIYLSPGERSVQSAYIDVTSPSSSGSIDFVKIKHETNNVISISGGSVSFSSGSGTVTPYVVKVRKISKII